MHGPKDIFEIISVSVHGCCPSRLVKNVRYEALYKHVLYHRHCINTSFITDSLILIHLDSETKESQVPVVVRPQGHSNAEWPRRRRRSTVKTNSLRDTVFSCWSIVPSYCNSSHKLHRKVQTEYHTNQSPCGRHCLQYEGRKG
jgi:hypothetical protein